MEVFAIGLLAFLAVGGLVGAVAMLTDPSGARLGMSTGLLQHTPVSNYFWPGVFLLLVMTVWPITNIVLLVTNSVLAPASITLLGVVCMVWIIYQVYAIRHFWFLQPVIFIVGGLLVITQL